MHTIYNHHGIISDNAVLENRSIQLDPAQYIRDEYYHPPVQLGNMEIWYADVYDPVNESVYVVQFTSGPDPLKKETRVYISFHAYTPDQGVTSLTTRIPVDQLYINEEPYRVTLDESVIECHVHPDNQKIEVHLQVNIEHVHLDIHIEPHVSPWLPFGNKTAFFDRERKGFFSWVPSVPKGKVNGTVTIGDSMTRLKDAQGYYDHTYWETGTDHPYHQHPLFWDDVLVSWMWLKIIQDDIKIAINEFRFRPWLKNRSVSSFMVCKNDSIILSQNHAAEFMRTLTTTNRSNRTSDEFELSFSNNDLNLTVEVAPTRLLRYQNMLEYTTPISRSLVRLFFGNPVAFYSLARADVQISFGNENLDLPNAMAFYEPMVLNTHPSRFEDRLRKIISRTISI